MIMIKFLVVNLSSPYNMILKQTWIHQMQIVYVLITKKILFPTMQKSNEDNKRITINP